MFTPRTGSSADKRITAVRLHVVHLWGRAREGVARAGASSALIQTPRVPSGESSKDGAEGRGECPTVHEAFGGQGRRSGAKHTLQPEFRGRGKCRHVSVAGPGRHYSLVLPSLRKPWVLFRASLLSGAGIPWCTNFIRASVGVAANCEGSLIAPEPRQPRSETNVFEQHCVACERTGQSDGHKTSLTLRFYFDMRAR